MDRPERFGEYLLLKKIAAGGMAEIYRSSIEGIGGFRREVAIKRILPQHDDPSFVSMLLDEARIAARLVHPNIAQVLNCGCIDNTYFIAMEYVDGQSLRRVLRRLEAQDRAMPVPVALFIGASLGRALGFAHRHTDDAGRPMHIVHRDVSPENVLVAYSGDVKLVDFGVARASGRLQKTATGLVRGKVAYMAPEHISGGQLDHRADQYAAGLVTLEVLTGRRAYTGTTEAEVIRSVFAGDVGDIAAMLADVPRREVLVPILQRALAKEPGQRYSSCDDFSNDLLRVLRDVDPAFSQEQVAALMQQTFGDEIVHSRAELAQLRQSVPDSSATEVPTPPPLHEAATVTLRTPSSAGAAEGEAPKNGARTRGRRVVLIGLATAAALGVGLALWSLQGRASLHITSEPSGARIRVDGAAVAGVTPTIVDGLPKGSEVEVRVDLEGYAPAAQRVPLGARTNAVHLTLTRSAATLEISNAPPGAGVYVNGQRVATADLGGNATAALPAEIPASIRVERPDGSRFETSRTPKAGTTVQISVPQATTRAAPAGAGRPTNGRRGGGARDRPAAAAGAQGSLDVACLPWCEIRIDGRLVQSSPLRNFSLPAGTHLIEVLNPPSGATEKRSVAIEPGKLTKLSFRLQR